MKRLPAYAWAFAAFWVAVAATIQSGAQTIDEVAQGKQVFATSCANSFCHGSEGGPGRGPRLRDRDWQRSYLSRTIENGVAGSAMPAWKDRLSQQQIHEVIQYILSVSHEIPAEAKAQAGDASSIPPVMPAAETNAAMRGRQIFFDLSNERNCGVCHRVHDEGQSIGPSLASLPYASNTAIVSSMLQPRRKPALKVLTTSGEAICGLESGGDSVTLQIYDIPSAGPPVLRTFSLRDIVSRSGCDLMDPHQGFSHIYTPEQLSDIEAFLKSSR